MENSQRKGSAFKKQRYAMTVNMHSHPVVPASAGSTDNERLASFLKNVADESCRKQLTGIAIGVIVDGQELRACSGWADVATQTPVSDSTIFEIGSLSKLFTSLLLAVAVRKQEVALDDPVQPALGDAVKLPTDGTSEITYRSLANHRSSLPRLPTDLFANADRKNPYAHYDQEKLYACLNKMETLQPIGSRGEYSNFGVGLLGHALGKLAGSDYHAALKQRVLAPLAMDNTSTTSRNETAAQLATPHKKQNKPTQHWDFTEVTVAAGGVRSSLSDMLKFLRANIHPETSALAEEIALMREPSKLPESQSARRPFMPMECLIGAVFMLAILVFVDLAGYWLIGRTPDVRLYVIGALTLGAALRWGWCAGASTVGLLTLLTWWLWGDGFSRIASLILGGSVTTYGAIWRTAARALYEHRGGGEGRLAWQRSAIGTRQMLWHNGMVGGSASFLGIVDELELGVVVLTNTAKSVDAVGVQILSELVEHIEIKHRAREWRLAENDGPQRQRGS